MIAKYIVPFVLIVLGAGTVSASEPIDCYEVAVGHPDNSGIGLAAGQAVELCSGTTNAQETLQCFTKAWSHKKNGGLGLTAGQAVTLCKSNSETSL
jgi:hypothetical protein